MAVFHYKMQNILNLKEKLEDQQKMEYGRANAALNEEQEKLDRLLTRKRQYVEDLKEAESGALDIRNITFLRSSVSAMGDLINDQLKNVAKARRRVEIEREKLDQAMKERKIHEKLREKAFDRFKAEMLYKENKETDELVAYTYNSGSNSLE